MVQCECEAEVGEWRRCAACGVLEEPGGVEKGGVGVLSGPADAPGARGVKDER